MSGFAELPTEMILYIFVQLLCFTDAIHLASVSRKTWNVWQDRSNAQTILDVIAPKHIECLPEAQRLLKSQSPQVFEPGHVHEMIKGLHLNRQRLAVGIDAFEKQEISRWLNPRRGSWRHPGPHLSPTELARFVPAWYTLWTCVYELDCQSVLNTTTLRTLQVAREVLLDMLDHNTVESCSDPEIGKHMVRLEELCSIFHVALNEKCIRLMGGPFLPPGLSDQASSAFAVLDGFQWAMEDTPDVV